MKKSQIKVCGRYAMTASRAIKGSERIFCQVDKDSGDIYITNGFVLFRMTSAEYDLLIRSVTCCDPGNWEIIKGQRSECPDGKRDIPGLLRDASKTAEAAEAAQRCPVSFPAGAGAMTAYHTAAGVVSFYNTKYVDALRPDAALRPISDKGAAVAYLDNEPYAMIMPIRPDPQNVRAVNAYFDTTAQAATPDAADVDALRAERDKLRDDLRAAQEYGEAKRAENEELYTRIAALEAAQAAPDGAAEDKPARSAAELIAARFTDFPGVTVTIKGAQTAAPVVWLTGATAEQADAIQAAGAKWSNKRGAYYVRCA